MKGGDFMEREIIVGKEAEVVYDTDPTPLSELLKKNIAWAYVWNDYYMFKLKTDDMYDNSVYVINKNTKKVEWGYYTAIGIAIKDEIQATEISPEELRRALS